MLNNKLPSKQIPAQRAMDIIRKASGMSVEKIKKNLRQFNVGEVKKISHNTKNNFITQKEMGRLLEKAKKAGMHLDSSSIHMAYKKINREEKKRKIQYGKERTRITDTLDRTKRGQINYTARDKSGNIKSTDQINNNGWSSPNNQQPKKGDKKDNSKPVIELPI